MVNRRKLAVLGLGALGFAGFAACSLTNLDEYTSGGGDTGPSDTGRDATTDSALDAKDTSSPLDALDTATDDTLDSGVAPDTRDSGDATLDTADTADTADTPDTLDTTPFDTGPDTLDALSLGDVGDASCPVTALGLSEVMVRAVAGTGDAHEWIELTNYGSCDLDIGGVTVRIVSSGGEKAVFIFPDGTTIAAGQAVVLADNDAVLKADLIPGYTLGTVFSLVKGGDVLVNGGNITVSLYGRGGGTAFEAALIPSRGGGSWPGLGRSYGYPVPSTACPASGRLSAGGPLSATWKDAPTVSTSQYGDAGGDTLPLYGSPTKPNVDIACP